MIHRGLYIRRGKVNIHGKWLLPEDGAKHKVIIICHEFGMHMRSKAFYGEALCEAGYAVFLFDFCGSGIGTSYGRRSVDMSAKTEVGDLYLVLDYVKTCDFVDASDITVLGCSQGGFVAAMASAKRKKEVKRLILYYPGFSMPDHAARGEILDWRQETEEAPETFTVLKRFKLGRRFLTDARAMRNWRERIHNYPNPVLIIHGTADRTVDIEYARDAARLYPRARLVEILGGDHLFPTEEERAFAIEETLRFLKETQGKKAEDFPLKTGEDEERVI